jgi:hypothetical protein
MDGFWFPPAVGYYCPKALFKENTMKKIILIVLVLLPAGAMALFADSADLLPARVFRFRIAPIFNFANGTFDEDGSYQKYGEGEGASKAYSTGFALEYGVLDWLSLAAQWTPGWVAWSDVDRNLGSGITVNANGVSDLFTGVAVQLVGEKAPVRSGIFRATLAPGLKIPFSGPDALDEYEKWKKGEGITAANPDKHSLGIGGRAYFDYIPGILDRHLVFNLYSEFIGYPLKSRIRNYSVAPILGRAAEIAGHYTGTADGQTELGLAYYLQTGQQPDPGDPAFQAWANGYLYDKIDQAAGEIADLDVIFSYDLTFEFEASVSGIPLDRNRKILFAAGLPFNYRYSPGSVVGFSAANKTSAFSINPYASVFLTSLPLPLQIQLGYNIPVSGVNSDARHTFVLQTKFFFRI